MKRSEEADGTKNGVQRRAGGRAVEVDGLNLSQSLSMESV